MTDQLLGARFLKPEKGMEMSKTMVKDRHTDTPGGCGNFVIRIQCAQNATWQGNIQWLEGKKNQNFRSALELINLMDEALIMAGQDTKRKWEEKTERSPAAAKTEFLRE